MSPDYIDVEAFGANIDQLATKLANEHIDDFWRWLINAAKKMAQECVFTEDGTLAKGQKLNDTEFLRGQIKPFFNDFRVIPTKIDDQITTEIVADP